MCMAVYVWSVYIAMVNLPMQCDKSATEGKYIRGAEGGCVQTKRPQNIQRVDLLKNHQSTYTFISSKMNHLFGVVNISTNLGQ